MDFDVELERAPGSSIQDTRIRVTIKAASVNTKSNLRDDHLREEDFFHVEKHPDIVFTSSKSEVTENGYLATGMLDFIGDKKPIDVRYSYNGKGTLKDGREFIAFRGEVAFDRYEYGMKPIPGTGAEIILNFRLELVRKNE